MDEVTLVSESFEKNGSGVSSNGLEFLTALKRYSTYKITAISTDIYLRKRSFFLEVSNILLALPLDL